MVGEIFQRQRVVRGRKGRMRRRRGGGWVKKHSEIPERRNLARRTTEQEQFA